MRGFGIHDVARISEAVSRPGIDPRVFTTLAVVNKVRATTEGVYCDVTTIMGVEETAALAPDYGGDGYGFYAPIEVGHMVLVAIPEGEYAAGPRVIAHIWDEGDPPPDVVVDHPEDVALVVKPGKTVRIMVSGGGTVLLGSDDPSKGVARETDPVKMDLTALQAILDLRYQPLPPVGPLPMTLPAAAPVAAATLGDPFVADGEIGEIAAGSLTVFAED